MPYVAQAVEGVSLDSPVSRHEDPLQTGSRIFSGSSWCSFAVGSGEPVPGKTHSDDKLVIEYTDTGLPCMLVVDGWFYADAEIRALNFRFIETQIIPLLPVWQQLYQRAKSYLEVYQKIVDQIEALRLQADGDNRGIEFTLAFACMFEERGEIRLATFSVGDSGFVLQRLDGSVEQLAFPALLPTEGAPAKCGFAARAKPRDALACQPPTVVRVYPGEMLVGYTAIPACLTETLSYNGGTLQRVTLKSADPGTLYDRLTAPEAIAADQAATRALALSPPEGHPYPTVRSGDDMTVGAVYVPTPALRQTMQEHLNPFLRAFGTMRRFFSSGASSSTGSSPASSSSSSSPASSSSQPEPFNP